MIESFTNKLIKKVIDSLTNNYKDNYDKLRFGEEKRSLFSLKRIIKENILYPRYISKYEVNFLLHKTLDFITSYGNKFEKLYASLNDEPSKELLIDIMAYRLLGYKKVMLKTNTKEYFTRCNDSYNYADKNDFIDLKINNWKLFNTNFSKYNLPINIYTMPPAMITYGFLGQYQYNNQKSIMVEKDDVVLDCGGCFGDTAIIFGYQAGINGKVYSFEFIPSNIEIFEKNIALNKSKIDNIEIIKKPLWESSDLNLFFKDKGPGSIVKVEKFRDADGTVSTISIDDFVLQASLPKVDFIKMDIEGAELRALKGAIATIIKFKPKLAISLYHSIDDFVDIHEFLHNLGLDYKFYLGHYTIHAEETVLYAIV